MSKAMAPMRNMASNAKMALATVIAQYNAALLVNGTRSESDIA